METLVYWFAVFLGMVIGACFSRARSPVRLKFDDIEIAAPTRGDAEALLTAVVDLRERERFQRNRKDGLPVIPHPQPRTVS